MYIYISLLLTYSNQIFTDLGLIALSTSFKELSNLKTLTLNF